MKVFTEGVRRDLQLNYAIVYLNYFLHEGSLKMETLLQNRFAHAAHVYNNARVARGDNGEAACCVEYNRDYRRNEGDQPARAELAVFIFEHVFSPPTLILLS